MFPHITVPSELQSVSTTGVSEALSADCVILSHGRGAETTLVFTMLGHIKMTELLQSASDKSLDCRRSFAHKTHPVSLNK